MILNIKEEDGSYSYIGYFPKIIDNSNDIFDWVNNMNDFKSGIFNNKEIPRLQKWYQIDGKYFSKTWKIKYERWEAFKYDEYLLNIQNKIKDISCKLLNKDISFNSCLINLYRNENDSIRPHSDSETSFGDNPDISVLSLGETREIFFKRKIFNKDNLKSTKADKSKEYLDFSLKLESGSLLIMSGSTQKYFFHYIPKEEEKKEKRYSLTFRKYI